MWTDALLEELETASSSPVDSAMTLADGRVGVPGWAGRASFAWKRPPVPGNSFQMFSPTGWLS
jgi:hypothetical protein